MPWGAVQLRPGVNTQLTPAANTAGVSQSQLIRYKEGLLQTNGGWQALTNTTITSTIRDLHPWQGIGNTHPHLAIGATQSLSVYHSDTFSISDITPQTTTTNPTLNFSASLGSCLITIVDNASNAAVSNYNTVYFNTPVAIAGFLLNGAYPIHTALSSASYTIVMTSNSTANVTSSGILPSFSITAGLQAVTVTLPNNNFQSIAGLFQQFIAPTTVGSGSSVGVVVQGKYQVTSVLDSTRFTINASVTPSTTATATMNATLAQIVYYVTQGPAETGLGFGLGAFGGTSSGGASQTGFGGTGIFPTTATGTPITTTDWTTDNWGEILLACPADGPIYAWSPDSGFSNAQVINQAPFFNGGIFVSMPQQILVAWKSVQSTGVQDPLIVRWSNSGDYTNWTVSNQTTAGSFHIPTGSIIMGGIQCPQFGLISTDIDVWTMTYTGGTVIFNFTRVGSGCGWIGSHACGVLAGNPYWMGTNNFFTLGAQGVVPLPCTVWDQVFQNLNTANQSKVRVAVNSAFNEIAWFYPSANATENDSYVRVHIQGQEFEWDYGMLNRTAWCDLSIFGMPLGADNSGQVYQHETGTVITGAGLPSFQTGYWAIGEGQDMAFIDMVIPDFIWSSRTLPPTATVQITFFVVNFPSDTPTQFGPYTVDHTTEFISLRARGKLMSALIQSNVSSEFWRLGRIRFRFATAGRR